VIIAYFCGKFIKKMPFQGMWENATAYQKLLLLVILLFLFGFVFTAIAAVIIKFIYGINLLTDMAALSDLTDPAVLSAMKILQGFTSFGAFIFAPLVAAVVFSYKPMRFLSIDKRPLPVAMMAAVALVFVSNPLINQLMVWNQHMSLPSSLAGLESWMKESEDKAAVLTEAFLKMSSPVDLLINLVIVSLIPAIGEELLFRGVIQPLFKALVKNTFLAVLFTAILFSAMHMQFYGFIPRMVLGMALGYLLEWSGSLWLPILVHFVNNGIQVMAVYFYPETDMESMGIAKGDEWQVVLSFVFTAALLFVVYFVSRKNREGITAD
jgi:membrane protease YdiL (CAAX protease family)